MRGNIQPASVPATSCNGTSVVEKTSDDISVADDGEWFAAMAQALLLPKPGTTLHYITGFDERSCQRYAAGTVKPPAYFLRAMLRSEQGEPFLNYLMDGSTAAWWREHQRAAYVCKQVDQLDLQKKDR